MKGADPWVTAVGQRRQREAALVRSRIGRIWRIRFWLAAKLERAS